MKIAAAGRILLKIVCFSMLSAILLVAGVVCTLYSPWLQRRIVRDVNSTLNTPALTVNIGSFSLKPPLRLSVDDVTVVSRGDTVASVGQMKVKVALLPLLAGNIRLSRAMLTDARINIGAPDSAMYMRIKADTLRLEPAVVKLPSLDINLKKGLIAGGRVDMTLGVDTTATQPSEPSTMKINVGEIELRRFIYSMKMEPTIDSLGAEIMQGTLRHGTIDMARQEISLKSLTGTGLDASYIAPDTTATTAATVDIPADATAAAEPWTVKIDTIGFDRSRGLYALAGYTPLPGLDFSYIEVGDLTLGIHDFYNRATDVVIPIAVTGTERCGVQLAATGTVRIDATSLRLDTFDIDFPRSGCNIGLQMLMGMGDMLTDPTLPLELHAAGAIGIADLRDMFPAFLPYLLAFPADDAVGLSADITGTMGDLRVDRIGLDLTRCASLSASGRIRGITDPINSYGRIDIDGRITNGRPIEHALFDKATDTEIDIPPMTVKGRVDLNGGLIDGELKAHTGKGVLALDGRWNSRHDDYTATLAVTDFPVEAFMPRMGIGDITASLSAKGHGYNPFDASMILDAEATVTNAVIGGVKYTGISADAHLADGHATVAVDSDMPGAGIEMRAEGNLAGDTYHWTATLDGSDIDLKALNLSTEAAKINAQLNADVTIGPKSGDIDARVVLNSLEYATDASTIELSDVTARLAASDSATVATLANRDLNAKFDAQCSLDTLLAGFTRLSDLAMKQFDSRNLRVDTLREQLPRFTFNLVGGNDNLITDILQPSGISLRHVMLTASNDSILAMQSQILGVRSGETRLDTVTMRIRQVRSSLAFSANVDNRPGTFDDFAHIGLKGFLRTNHVGIHLTQSNIQGKTGYDIGMRAQLLDSVFTVSLSPYTPTIGYKKWTVNSDNFISYELPDKHIDANLHMTGENSSLNIYTEHAEGSHDQEDIVVQLSDIHLADWISINPFAPPVNGDLGANLHVNYHEGDINGAGTLSLTNFTYGRKRVSDFMADFDVNTNATGTVRAKMSLYVDSVKAMTLSGVLNDTTLTSPMALDMKVIRFPLATVNPFMPARTATLRGVLNGEMTVSGDFDTPLMNGWLDFEDTSVNLAMMGTDYAFSPTKIPVDNSKIQFNNFSIKGANDNPLAINGTVDISRLASPQVDLALKADNMQLVNTSRARRGAEVYGKAFVSLDAKVRGNLNLMKVDATLDMLPGTNATYIMTEAAESLTSQSTADIVKFVNFSDTTEVQHADTIKEASMMLFVNAMLNIQNGVILNVDLDSGGKNKVQLQPTGSLNYQMSPVMPDGRLTGRIDIEKGFARYTLPPLSEKLFNFQPDSYVSFTGDILNPTLNVHAVDVVKANVTQSGQNSRLVDFNVLLAVTGTLNTMKVEFDLSTDNDLTVANELQGMSQEQRAAQAMNLLLYNMYTAGGTSTTQGSASLSSKLLYNFVEGQINSWAAKNIKGVDLSFGIDQYDNTTNGQTQLTTSYSYQVSKSLFNDRFKIVVGGNYSTDANADENFSENLINDISFEYFLNNARTMYVRLFRHTGYESILEGEITQTGVGFVYKRRLRRIGDLFGLGSIFKKDKSDKSTAK